MRDVIYRTSLNTLREERGFNNLSSKTRTDILLAKAAQYEKQLDGLRSIVSGVAAEGDYEYKRYLLHDDYGYMFDNRDPADDIEMCRQDGKHIKGTERTCRICTIYMIKLIAKDLSLPDTTP